MKTYESIEHPGYMVTTHPKPPGYETKEWFNLCRSHHCMSGHVILDTLAYSNPIWDDPNNPMYRKEVGREWGVEVIWRPIND